MIVESGFDENKGVFGIIGFADKQKNFNESVFYKNMNCFGINLFVGQLWAYNRQVKLTPDKF